MLFGEEIQTKQFGKPDRATSLQKAQHVRASITNWPIKHQTLSIIYQLVDFEDQISLISYIGIRCCLVVVMGRQGKLVSYCKPPTPAPLHHHNHSVISCPNSPKLKILLIARLTCVFNVLNSYASFT